MLLNIQIPDMYIILLTLDQTMSSSPVILILVFNRDTITYNSQSSTSSSSSFFFRSFKSSTRQLFSHLSPPQVLLSHLRRLFICEFAGISLDGRARIRNFLSSLLYFLRGRARIRFIFFNFFERLVFLGIYSGILY